MKSKIKSKLNWKNEGQWNGSNNLNIFCFIFVDKNWINMSVSDNLFANKMKKYEIM